MSLRKKHKRVILLLVAVLTPGLIGYLFFSRQKEGKRALSPLKAGIEVKLCFPSQDSDYLIVESQKIARMATPVEQAKLIIEALIKGPKSVNLVSAISEGTHLRGLELKNNCAYVDFSQELIDNHPGGSSAEVMTIFEIVNTLILNLKEIKRVQILVEGKMIETIAGHIDTSGSFRLKYSLLRESDREKIPDLIK